MRARGVSVTAEGYEFGERWLREVVNDDLPMPAGQLVDVPSSSGFQEDHQPHLLH
jgi:hypothetical protein